MEATSRVTGRDRPGFESLPRTLLFFIRVRAHQSSINTLLLLPRTMMKLAMRPYEPSVSQVTHAARPRDRVPLEKDENATWNPFDEFEETHIGLYYEGKLITREDVERGRQERAAFEEKKERYRNSLFLAVRTYAYSQECAQAKHVAHIRDSVEWQPSTSRTSSFRNRVHERKHRLSKGVASRAAQLMTTVTFVRKQMKLRRLDYDDSTTSSSSSSDDEVDEEDERKEEPTYFWGRRWTGSERRCEEEHRDAASSVVEDKTTVVVEDEEEEPPLRRSGTIMFTDSGKVEAEAGIATTTSTKTEGSDEAPTSFQGVEAEKPLRPRKNPKPTEEQLELMLSNTFREDEKQMIGSKVSVMTRMYVNPHTLPESKKGKSILKKKV